MAADLPESVSISGAEIKVTVCGISNGVLCYNLAESKSLLKMCISKHCHEVTGFLLWIGTYCISCVVQQTIRIKDLFSLVVYDDSCVGEIRHVKSIKGVQSLVEEICKVTESKLNFESVRYEIQFLLCSCNIESSERKKIARKHRYSSFEYCEMEPVKKKVTFSYKEKRNKADRGIDFCIEQFRNKIREGPCYICCVCNRLLYRRSVIIFCKSKYLCINFFSVQSSFDGKEYICKTCHLKVKDGKLPCQAVVNNMFVDEIPRELATLEKLEQILIAQRIVFEKIIVMPKGQQRKIKGAICNVPVECDQTCSVLPRPSERSGIIMLKLKRKLEFKGYVYFEAVRPEFILESLIWLKSHNVLYKDIKIDVNNIDQSFTCLEEENNNEEEGNMNDGELVRLRDVNSNSRLVDNNMETDACNDNEENDDPQIEYQSSVSETCLQSRIPNYRVGDGSDKHSTGIEVYSIAPGEDKQPLSFFSDKQSEELAFPVLFPKGRFGYMAEREVKLSVGKYFNARLLHYSGRFASNAEYLFFAQFIIEQKKISEQINIALKKVCGQRVTASQLKSNPQMLQNLICQEQAYLFLQQIRGSPPYWQKFMYEILGMVKQLGIPTWFMTLSCADLRWPELFQIIAKMQGRSMCNEEVESLSYNEKCQMLNTNPVIVAKHFQYRVETFFTEILLSDTNPIGKIVYYALRIEFQMRGSPHLHALIWTSDCPKLDCDNKDTYIDYIDKHVQAFVPSKETDGELHELVNMYQRHSHSKSCRKYKNVQCRFHFGKFFTDRTIVAEPLSEELDESMKSKMLQNRNEILSLVKQKIDDVLNPSLSTYNSLLTEDDIFTSIGISKDQYLSALSISSDSNYELHLKRSLDSCFINNYFIAGLKGFGANVDLQPVFDHYKCITYVCSYFTKDETQCLQAIMNAAKEAKAGNMEIREGLRKIGAAFLSSREVSSQECVYRCMPELWLRKIFPRTVFVNTDLPDKRVRVAKTQQELEELDDESTDIFKSNIIERYKLRPTSIAAVNDLCLCEFAAYYYKEYKKKSCDEASDAQPEVLTDDTIEIQHSSTNSDLSLPRQIKLINSGEIMKCRKIKAVIRYHTPNKRKEPEVFFHHLLMLYYPWRDEGDLCGKEGSYISKFYERDVQAIVEHNRAMFEPNAEAVSDALQWLRNNNGNVIHSFDCINDQENEDIQLDAEEEQSEDCFNEQLPSHFDVQCQSTKNKNRMSLIIHNQPSEVSDDELRESVRLLTSEQREAFDVVFSWCRDSMKNLNSLRPKALKPIYLFLSGGGGCGKSFLIKTIYHTVTKTFRYAPTNLERPTVLLMAPTGVAAINIEGTTINSALAIPKNAGYKLPAMSDPKKTQMRLLLSEVKLLIIDEISMVSNVTLLHIHQRLQEIFGTSGSVLFGGKSIIAVGDLFQLEPIRSKPVFENYKDDTLNICHPWHVFQMIELRKVMRQKDDKRFTDLLNRLRVGSQTDEDIQLIQSRSINSSDPNYPHDVLHIWAENNPVNQYNNMRLQEINKPLFYLRATDQYPANVSEQEIENLLGRQRSETGGLDFEISVKETARVMLTTNIDIADRLINGQLGTIMRINVSPITQNPTIIYIKFDDSKAGKNRINKSNNQFAKKYNFVPIEPILARFKVRPEKTSSPEIQRVQFPITLAWACTVHKVQGLTLDKIVVSLSLHGQKYFNYGQIYVAISRCKTLEGIHILGNIKDKHVRVNSKVHEEYERLRRTSFINKPAIVRKNEESIIITVLNIRSLLKHSVDIKFDGNINDSDLLLLTETQLFPEIDDEQIRDNLPYTLHREDNVSDKFCSLALCTKSNIEIRQYEYFPALNVVKFVAVDTNTKFQQTIVLLYRKQRSNISDFVEGIRYLLLSDNVDILLGDFNINYFSNDDMKGLQLLTNSLNYAQVVQSPTFISSGSLLDHVYVKSVALPMVEHSVISCYYSDHEAVKVRVKVH